MNNNWMRMFTEWLLAELNKRDWIQADLARASGLTTASISKYFAGRVPEKDALKKIAKALKLPPETVFQAAGILPEQAPESKMIQQIKYFLENVPEEERQNILDYAKHRFELSEQREKNESRQPRKKPTTIK